MKHSYLSICLLVLFVAESAAASNYITWKDLIVNNERMELRQERVIVVDKKGGGDSLTVQGAVDMVPPNNANRVKIHILPGLYSEKVHIPITKPYISLIGDPNEASATVISWHDKASDRNNHGGVIGTQNSYTVSVESDYFCASGITFQNTVVSMGGDGYQAVALRIAGDKSVFYKARVLGSQDTLLDEMGTHYFLHCFIQGSSDFIFGNARSLYQECTISVVGYSYAIAAQSRSSASQNTGFSFVNCTVRGTGTRAVFLGRSWGDYSRVIYSYCEFNINVAPQGWDDWGNPSRHKTAVFGEYECRGRGADRRGRVAWSNALSYLQAKPYLDTSFISGEQWLRL